MENKNKCHLLQQKHYMLFKMKFCMYETYIGKTVGDHIHGFKTRINNNTESRSGVST